MVYKMVKAFDENKFGKRENEKNNLRDSKERKDNRNKEGEKEKD